MARVDMLIFVRIEDMLMSRRELHTLKMTDTHGRVSDISGGQQGAIEIIGSVASVIRRGQ